MAGDILTQEEIDALLAGVDGGDIDTDGEDEEKGIVRAYDFTSYERIVRGRLPTLEMINERFARNFRVDLFNLLRRTAELSIEGVKMLKFGEYLQSLFVPTSLSMLQVKPLKGTALFMIEPRLVYVLVDNFFGGSGRHAKIEGREFTPTELRVIERLLGIAADEFMEAWRPVKEIDIVRIGHEMNPQLANIVAPSEVVVVCSFNIELEGGGGRFQFTMPYTMIEPIRDLLDAGLQSERLEVDERWTKAMRRELAYAEMDLNCHLADVRIGFEDLLNLRVGDVIPVDLPRHVTLMAEGVPLFLGTYGNHKGSLAFQMEDKAPRDEEYRSVTPNIAD